MKYQVAIRKNSTGEVRLCPAGVPWGDGSVYWWTDGNMGCDCNRHICFERAGGNEDVDMGGPCSDGLYSALYALLADGTKVPLDEEMVAA